MPEREAVNELSHAVHLMGRKVVSVCTAAQRTTGSVSA